LLDLINAETEEQRRQSQSLFSGELGRTAQIWRSDLIHAAALIEATIDFADEDVPTDVSPEVNKRLEQVIQSLEQQIKGVDTAERIRSGFEVAILGPPNVGKSTLLNRIAGREAAITSEIAGTTRDTVEVRTTLNGLPVTFIDTAGLRDTSDTVEAIGIERAKTRAAAADLRIYLNETNKIEDILIENADIILTAKSDLIKDYENGISGLTGQGVDTLLEQIGDILSDRASHVGVATNMRHATALKGAVINLRAALDLLSQNAMQELIAQEIRNAIQALDEITGRVDVENILDEIFKSFCLGK